MTHFRWIYSRNSLTVWISDVLCLISAALRFEPADKNRCLFTLWGLKMCVNGCFGSMMSLMTAAEEAVKEFSSSSLRVFSLEIKRLHLSWSDPRQPWPHHRWGQRPERGLLLVIKHSWWQSNPDLMWPLLLTDQSQSSRCWWRNCGMKICWVLKWQ